MRTSFAAFPFACTISITYLVFLKASSLQLGSLVLILLATIIFVPASIHILGCTLGRTARQILYMPLALAHGVILVDTFGALLDVDKSDNAITPLNVLFLAVAWVLLIFDGYSSKGKPRSDRWPECLPDYNTSTLNIPSIKGDSSVSNLIHRLEALFPLPPSSSKGPLKLSEFYRDDNFDKRALAKLHDALPFVGPSDYLALCSPHYLSEDLYISYAITFLVSEDHTTLGLDPRQCGLWVDMNTPSSVERFILGEWAFGDVWSTAICRRLNSLDRLFGLCSIEQRLALFEYLRLFSRQNGGIFDGWIEFLTVRLETNSQTCLALPDIVQ